MKKTLKLTSLSLLTLALVGCTPTKPSGSEKQPSDSAPASSTSVVAKNVIERWWSDLSGEIGLKGNIAVKSTQTDETGTPLAGAQTEEVSQTLETKFSSDKFYCNLNGNERKYQPMSEADIDPSDPKDVQDADRKHFGEAITRVLKATNKIGVSLWKDSDTGKNYNFDDFRNPLAYYLPSDYKLLTDNTFTLSDETKIPDIASKLTGLSNPFKTLLFKEIDNKLQVEVSGDQIVSGYSKYYKNEYVLTMDLTVEPGEAFESVEPLPETDESKKLKEALDEMISTKSYSVSDKFTDMDYDTMQEVEKDETYYIFETDTTKGVINTTSKEKCYAMFSDNIYYTFHYTQADGGQPQIVLDNQNWSMEDEMFKAAYTYSFSDVASEVFTYNSKDDTYSLNEIVRESDRFSVAAGMIPGIYSKLYLSMGYTDFRLKISEDNNGKHHLSKIFAADDIFATPHEYTYSQAAPDISSFDFDISKYNLDLDAARLGEYVVPASDLQSWQTYKDGLTIKLEAGEGTSKAKVTINGSTITDTVKYIAGSLVFTFEKDSVKYKCYIQIEKDGTISFFMYENSTMEIYDSYLLYPKAVQDAKDAARQQLDAYDTTNAEAIKKLSDEDQAKIKAARKKADVAIRQATSVEAVDKAVADYKKVVDDLLKQTVTDPAA